MKSSKKKIIIKKKLTIKKRNIKKRSLKKKKIPRRKKTKKMTSYVKNYNDISKLLMNKTIEQKYKILENKLFNTRSQMNNEENFSNTKIRKELNTRIKVIRDLLEEVRELNVNTNIKKIINLRYPNVYDKDFNKKIFKKQEFYTNRVKKNVNIRDMFYQEHNLHSKKTDSPITKYNIFNLSPTQKLLRNFMSPNTPYNGILIFHGVGVGKTCASISIVEQFKKNMLENHKKIFVIRPAQIKNQIFDINLVKKKKY